MQIVQMVLMNSISNTKHAFGVNRVGNSNIFFGLFFDLLDKIQQCCLTKIVTNLRLFS